MGLENGTADSNKNPQFAKLLVKLNEHLTEKSIKRETEAKLSMSRKMLEEKRKRFLKSKVLLQIITDVSCDPSCPVQAEISNQLTLAQLPGFLSLGTTGGMSGRSEEISTLGLSPEDIPAQKMRPEVQKVLRESIEDRLFEEAKSLHCILNSQYSQETSRSLLHPHLVRLNEKVSDMQKAVEDNQNERNSIDISLLEAISKQKGVLVQLQEKLELLVDQHYTGSKLESTSLGIQYMRSKSETLRLKLKCLEMEIQLSTYTKDSVRAIKLVKDRLLEKIQKSESELAALTNTISQFRSVGPEFSDLLKEYSSILKQIQEKKWALKELTGGAL